MAFQFPEDKRDFTGPNGINYTYVDGSWQVRTFGQKQADLSGLVTTEDFEQDQKRQDDDIEAGYDTQSSMLLKNIEQDQRLDELDGEVDGLHDSQEVQDSQINALEVQIQILAQAQAVGKWRYVRNINGTSIRPPANRTFYGTNANGTDIVLTEWEDIRLMMIHKTDLNGTTFTFSNFEEGDKVEILATDGSSACYGTVTNNPTNEGYGNMLIAVERSNGGPVEDHEYLISVYRPGASGGGEVDLDLLDQRYLQLTGGTLSSSLRIQRGAEKTHPQYKISPNGGTDYATNIYTLEGQMRLRTSPSANESDASGSHIMLDPDVAGGGANPQTKIWKLATPTSNDMAANKGYVDGRTPDATNLVKGVTYKGQACVTGNSTPDASSFSQGQLVFSTSSNSLYIRT